MTDNAEQEREQERKAKAERAKKLVSRQIKEPDVCFVRTRLRLTEARLASFHQLAAQKKKKKAAAAAAAVASTGALSSISAGFMLTTDAFSVTENRNDQPGAFQRGRGFA
jgi:hypothetical protein